jgi:tight adherence protein B
MARNVALLLFIAAALLVVRAAIALLWPPLRSRVDRAEALYAERLKDLFRPMSAARAIARWQYFGSLVLVLVIFLLTGNPVFAVVIPVACFALPGLLFTRWRQQRLDRINRQLPDALRVMADAAKAGLSLPQMIRMVAGQGHKPVSEEFGLIVHAMDLGDSVDEAIKRVAARLQLQNFDLMMLALLVNRERGGDIGELLVRLSESIYALSTVEERIDIETSSVRMSAKIMVGTIPAFGLALFLIDPDAVGSLFTTPLGAAILLVVAGLATAGYRMIQKLASPAI